ncbi:hypothetical protein [Pseudoalteromonas sp. NZS11_1]|uniref:hypothetical protein n=1 Tax=Pseudoalteromonas sp. NZS11_1 TaxID=2792070 RepID=UPI0018CEDC77|nr:hypothetical protein [Pseudoalteromonas sp. NZS11_1]MBH0048448.1 hypothetical protein [Pseudoalteromonas sp. NZS11_1]
MNILPLLGLSTIKFGDSKYQAIELFGKPDEIENELGKDGVSSEIWNFQSLGVRLYFDPDFNFILWDVSISSDAAQLDGIRPIGLNESELLASFPALVLEVSDGIFKEYVNSEYELVFFLRNGIVKRIDVSPNLDNYIKRFG